MNDLSLEEFARELASDVDEVIEKGLETPYHEREFTRIVIEDLSEEGALENPMTLWQEGTFSRAHFKISGYSIPDDPERLTLITTVYVGDPAPRQLTHDEILTACQQAIKFYECSCQELYKQIEPSNTDASDLARRIYEARDQIGTLRVIVLSDGIAGLKSIDLKKAFDGTRVIVDLFGIDRLHRILGKGFTRDDIVIDVQEICGHTIPALKVSTPTEGYDAYVAALPGAFLADIYEKYGTRLLELNVRAFLGLSGRKSVNANLRKTIKEQPDRFLAYNNGIVATVDNIEVFDDGKGRAEIRVLRGLQIVNGGQTTASLHRALRVDRASLDAIHVPAKIISVTGANLDEMVAAISRSANSQNTVQPADFSSNEPFHVAVENLANNVWLPSGSGRWFYERARGSYGAEELASSTRAEKRKRFALETPRERRLSKTDLAKYLNAWDGFPHLVSYGNQKNFQFFMQAMKERKSPSAELDQTWFKALIAKGLIFRAVQSIVKSRKFPAYQANIVAYAVSCLSFKTGGELDFGAIWTAQDVSRELRQMLNEWVAQVDVHLRATAEPKMPSEWAKKAECWDAFQHLELAFPSVLPMELASGAVDLESGIRNIARSNAAGGLEDEVAGPVEPEDWILGIRDTFADGEARDRDEAIVALARQFGFRRTGPRIREDIEKLLRTAVRRGILASKGRVVSLGAGKVTDYDRSVLKDQFIASMPSRSWIERTDSIVGFARWLGYRRTGAIIDETARSIITGLIREARLESDGSRIRRT
ncbi:AIPR family protein [Tardiphaga sp. 11_C7_N12_6]|uniref:AIPR family protein n=1 Tax=Tardiphaga sp. 11_C7_N12_6 TaxID=3240789 RepID=UPI003F1EF132